MKATKNFKSDFVLGEGAFGKVFKGYINVPHLGAHLACAVKRLNPESLQGQEEWMVSEKTACGASSIAHHSSHHLDLVVSLEFRQKS